MTTIHKSFIKLASVLALCIGFAQLNNAQTSITGFGSIGFTNVEVSGLGILDVVDPFIKPITQYTAGVQYEKYLNPRLSFVTGGQYASRGFGVRENFNVDLFGLDLPIGATIETRINYLEVPVMLKYEFTEDGVVPFIKAGASAAYAINGKIQPKVNVIITWNLLPIKINLEGDMYNRL